MTVTDLAARGGARRRTGSAARPRLLSAAASAGAAHGAPAWRRCKWPCIRLLVAGLLLWSVPAPAQVDPRAWVEVAPARPMAGAEFRLDIHVSGMLLDSLRVTAPAPPPNLEFVSGPRLVPPAATTLATDGMVVGADATTGAPVVQRRVVTYTVRASRPGRYLLDGFLIGLAGKVVSTRETPVQVLEPPPEETGTPVVRWELTRHEALVGETISVHLVLVRWDELRLAERIEVEPPAASRFERYTGAATIAEQDGPAGRGYRIPLASYLLTPTRAGPITVAPAKVTLATAAGSATLLSEAVRVAVREPPPEIAASGAIGSLRAQARIERRPHPEGAEVTVAISVEGSGNHRFVTLPEPRADGMAPLDRVLRDELVAQDSGYTGQVVALHRYLATAPGRYRVEVPEFVSFDSRTGTVRRDPGLTRVLELTAPMAADGAVPPPSAVDGIALRRCRPPWRSARSYLLLLPGPLIGGCLALARKRRPAAVAGVAVAAVAVTAVALAPATVTAPEAAQRVAAEAERAYLRHDYAVAEAGYRDLREQLGCHPAPSYNLALAALGRGDDADAIGWLREALRRAPLERRYRALLRQVERRAGLETQHRPMPFVPPVVPFHALLLVAGCVVAVAGHHPAGERVLRRLRSGVPARMQAEERREARPRLAVLLAAAVLFAGVLGMAVVDQARTIVVVGDTELRRIPHRDAVPWLALPAGTTLEVRGEHGEHLLVRTGYGLDAWVSRDRLSAFAIDDAAAVQIVR